jgi:hypothetical protein
MINFLLNMDNLNNQVGHHLQNLLQEEMPINMKNHGCKGLRNQSSQLVVQVPNQQETKDRGKQQLEVRVLRLS